MSYTIAVIGDAGVGKTSFITSLKLLPLSTTYESTLEHEVHPIGFETNRGFCIFNVWEFAGKEEFTTSSPQTKFDLVLILYSLDRKTTYKSATEKWVKFAAETLGTTNYVLVANKSDIDTQPLQTEDWKISCKEHPHSAIHILQKLLYKMTGDNELFLI
jgi:GTP-binding nuclear protein Ran